MTSAAPAAPLAAAARPSDVRLPLAGVLAGACVVTLLRPVSWALGLAGFLAGGGVLVVAWPILVLPTPTGLQNALGGPISSLVFGGPSSALVALLAGGTLAVIALVVAGLLAGGWAERAGIEVALAAAADDGLLPTSDLAGAPGWGRVALVRLLSLAPLAVAAGLAWQPLYDAAYHELILPGDLATPLPVRVLLDAPLPLLGIAVAWLLGDAAGAVAARRLVLERRPVLEAWLLGWWDLVRRPQRVLPVALAGLAILVLALLPGLAAAAVGWTRVREMLVEGREPPLLLAAVAVWVAVWLGGLVLAGVAAAVRAASWTLELPRPAAPADALPDGDSGSMAPLP